MCVRRAVMHLSQAVVAFFDDKRNTPGFDNPRSVSACVPEAFALSTSL